MTCLKITSRNRGQDVYKREVLPLSGGAIISQIKCVPPVGIMLVLPSLPPDPSEVFRGKGASESSSMSGTSVSLRNKCVVGEQVCVRDV